MASSSKSKETRALQQCSADLTNHLQHNILAVSSSLLAKGLITDELFQWVLTAQGVSALNKAARVVACISDRVRGSPESFDALLDVLKQDQYYADVVEKLTTLRAAASLGEPGVTSLSPSEQKLAPRLPAEMYEKPKLRDAFKDLLPLAHEWSTIGILLGIPKHILERIKADENGARNRLQEMLSEWLKQVDPEPTWASLVEAVENVDQGKAQEIRTRFSS